MSSRTGGTDLFTLSLMVYLCISLCDSKSQGSVANVCTVAPSIWAGVSGSALLRLGAVPSAIFLSLVPQREDMVPPGCG